MCVCVCVCVCVRVCVCVHVCVYALKIASTDILRIINTLIIIIKYILHASPSTFSGHATVMSHPRRDRRDH